MNIGEIQKLVDGTADPAFAIDSLGLIAAWNQAAVDLFGYKENEVIGRFCGEVVQGHDECGRACSKDCTIPELARNRQPLRSYDIQVTANGKRQWCNVAVLRAEGTKTDSFYTVHIARPADIQKRFEILVRDFVVNETNLPAVNVSEILSAKRTPTSLTEFSKRETEILRYLAKGSTSASIAAELFISRTTVNNHVQRILKKLGAHTRLEAVRRAEKARLI